MGKNLKKIDNVISGEDYWEIKINRKDIEFICVETMDRLQPIHRMRLTKECFQDLINLLNEYDVCSIGKDL